MVGLLVLVVDLGVTEYHHHIHWDEHSVIHDSIQ